MEIFWMRIFDVFDQGKSFTSCEILPAHRTWKLKTRVVKPGVMFSLVPIVEHLVTGGALPTVLYLH